MRLGNTEWFRNPPSQLEQTLRRSILHREAVRLFLVRFLPLWIIVGLLLGAVEPGNFRTTNVSAFFLALVIEMLWLRWWYERFFLPVHLRRINRIKQLASTTTSVLKNPNVRTDKNKIADSIEESVRLATRGLVEIGYVGFPAWGWEIVFRAIYPLLVKPPRSPYHELLIGFPNKSTEGDQMLWEISQMRDRDRDRDRDREKRIKDYVEEFGSKVEDVDLSFPTLAEKPEVIASMITLYRNSPSPFSLLQKAASRRKTATKDILKHLRIPQALFKKLLVLVQQNVRLREDRRHYEFLGDYPIRLMLIELAKQLKISEKELFNTDWKKLRLESFWRERSDR